MDEFCTLVARNLLEVTVALTGVKVEALIRGFKTAMTDQQKPVATGTNVVEDKS